MNYFSFPGTPLAATRIVVLIAAMLTTSLLTQAQVVFDNSLDVGPPPSTLGPYRMTQVVDNTNENGSLTNSVPLPNGGNITLNNEFGNGTNPLTVVSPGTFFPWGNGYSGKAYGNLDSQRIRLYFPSGLKAFYLYAKPLFIRGDMTVTAYSESAIKANVNFPKGVSFTRTVSFTEAQFFGFRVTNPDDEITYITIESTSPNPYVGEFGVAFACTDTGPVLTATNKLLTCANPSSTLTGPGGGSSYTFTGPNNFSQSGPGLTARVTTPGTYSLIATLAGGCTARGTVTLTEDKAVPSAFFRNDGPLTCDKTSVTLTAFNQNNTNGFTYVFSGPDGFSQGGGSSTASVSAPGTYSLIIRGNNGCLSPEYTTSVTSNTNAATSVTQPLFDLYNATGGANWTRKDNWLTGCSPCGWYGVSCDGNGRVTGLNLAGNNLVGTLPTSLSALSALQTLNLSTNQLRGSIPASLSALRALQRLNLIGNQLDGTLPVSLSVLSALQSLELGANPLTGGIPSGIGSLTALQTLNLSRTQLGGSIPASLGQLTQLRNLLLNESALTGPLPESLGTLTQLQNLQLYTNQLSGCFPSNYTSLCGRAQISFANNPGLPGGGDFAAFCSSGSGSELVVSQGPQSGSACVGSAFRFSVVARGAGSYEWYKLGPGPGQFQRLAETGPVLSFSSVSASDAGSYQVVINYACRPGGLQSDVVTLTVPQPGTGGCAQDNTAPVATANASQTATAGRTFAYTVNAFTDAQTPTGLAYSATLDPTNSGLSFDAASRVISGTPNQPGPVSVTITATDPGNLSASTSFTITVSPAPVVVTPLSLSLTASPPTILTTGTTTLSARVSGGTTPYSYSFSGPGTISQSPTSNTASVSGLPAGVQTFTVVVRDATQPVSQTTSATVSVTVTQANTAPTAANAIPPQSATVGQAFSYLIPASTFTDAQTPNALSLSVSGLPPGISFTDPATLSGVPSVSGVSSVTVTATDPEGQSVSTSFVLTVSPASSMTTTAPFAITGVSTLSCSPVGNQISLSFTPQYAGLTGEPVSFSVVSELAPTTNPGPYTLRLYTDNPTIRLQAIQAGVVTSFAYNWLAACQSGGNPTPTNTAPRLAQAVSPQSATVNQSYTLNVATVFTDSETPTNLVLSASGLPTGLSLTGTTLSGTPSGSGTSTVVLRATDPGSLSASTSFELTVSPATTNPFPAGLSITGVQTLSCVLVSSGQRSVTFQPQYAGQTGQAILFSVVNETAPTTASGPYTLRLYTDNPTITLRATQSGTAGEASFAYNWLVACPTGSQPNQPPTTSGIPNQQIVEDEPYQLLLTDYFADAQPLTFSASGLPPGLSLSGSLISGRPSATGVSTVNITALDPGGLQVSTSFSLTVTPRPTTPAGFTITGVSLVSCEGAGPNRRQLRFTPQYAGADNAPIRFSVTNELSPTTDAGPYTLLLYTDNPAITLSAQQGNAQASFRYDWLQACSAGARVSAEPGSGLSVRVLGNPVQGSTVQVEVLGAEGQPLRVQLTDAAGRAVSERLIERAGAVELLSLPSLSSPAGLLLLRISTPTQSRVIKVLKAD